MSELTECRAEQEIDKLSRCATTTNRYLHASLADDCSDANCEFGQNGILLISSIKPTLMNIGQNSIVYFLS